MPNNLRLALLSLDIAQGDKEKNLDGLDHALSEIEEEVDVVVLPELFSTGFTSKADRLNEWAETNGGETMARLGKMANRHNFAIAGSFLARTATKIYNRGFFIEPSGESKFYDKRHLFSMSSESSLLSQGDDLLPVVRFRGWNIALAVCYDLRFPVWCRNVRLGYDVLLFVANWPRSRQYAWRHLLMARAIENQSYVVGVDRSGEDKFGVYDDMTLVADYSGRELKLDRSEKRHDVSFVTLDRSALYKWREDFTAWKDADNFTFRP